MKKTVIIAFIILVMLMISMFLLYLNFGNNGKGTKRTFLTDQFYDGFENIENVNELFPRDFSRWHGVQNEPNKKNIIEISQEQFYSGKSSLKLFVRGSDSDVGKADIIREGFSFEKGEDIWFSGQFYFVSGSDMREVFILDFEDSKMFKSWGRRVYIQNGEKLASDGKWFPKPETYRSSINIKKDEWTEIKVHLYLSEDDKGLMEVWQDGIKLISEKGPTLPRKSAIYDRIQVGITANGEYDQTVYIDDIRISNSEIVGD